ncbi:hypothetical protein O0L34_g1134 [Tuta absoluta]|nr:hypothetical protein O0L34_g1134 [Tuta absoluta]
MVTSNKLPDKKVVKMSEQNNSVVVPQRTLLGEVNEHITCPLCRGYYIDATTIVECLHSFCRSCIIKHLQVKSYCPVCEMMINSAKPNIKLDKALQDIVYKLVPGLFQREMERRQTFYASRPGPAACATPEQRGEDTERIIFSPGDVISFSLEYADATDTDSISSKSSDSNEPQTVPAAARRYLQCPAVVNISHLKKFLSMKFDIDSTQFAIDILYKRVPLPDYYTLMDIAYIYNWKRNEPMRFFYQIIDFVAIRNRFFDINRKGTNFRDRKSSPASTEDTNASSPAPHINDHGSEASSGTDSPMPEDNSSKQTSDKKTDKCGQLGKFSGVQDNLDKSGQTPKKNDDEVEKSQFLISFELTAKSNSSSAKSSPVKNSTIDNVSDTTDPPSKNETTPSKAEDSLKRKHQPLGNMPEMKKLKIELEKTKFISSPFTENAFKSSPSNKTAEALVKPKDNESTPKTQMTTQTSKAPSVGHEPAKEPKQQHPTGKPQPPDSPATKRPTTTSQTIASPKRKLNETHMPNQPPSNVPKTVSPLKLQFPKSEPPFGSSSRPVDLQKPVAKKLPDLKPSVPLPQTSQSKGQPTSKVRMDLLANNCDPTMDRSKILSQVKTSLSIQSPVSNTGDPLKSLFDSCKINIPSSLSITLTDQKQDSRNPTEPASDSKKNVVNKNLTVANNPSSHKVPSPPVHNYIEILKLPDSDPKKPSKLDGSSDNKPNTPNKTDPVAPQPKPPSKSSETSAKGPIPNLKPIADTKLGKQSGASTSTTTSSGYPITFQQTFEQQLQSLQSDKKPKLQKNKAQVPKLVPANPKTFNAATAAAKINSPGSKPPSTSGNVPLVENKPSAALDLTTPSNMQSQLTPHQTKAFETMQSKAFEIANLAKKQNLASKGPPPAIPHNFSGIPNRPIPTNAPLRLPPMANQLRQDKSQSGSSSLSGLSNCPRQDIPNKTNQLKPTSSPGPISSLSYQMPPHTAPAPAQPSPRQTRSPSSSPKLVIAEEKQSSSELNVNQSNQITSTQAPSNSAPKSESPKISPGPSKPVPKPMKPMPPANRIPGIRPPIAPTVRLNPSPADFISAHHALLRNMEINAWLKAQKIMTNMAHQAQNDFNKDKQ